MSDTTTQDHINGWCCVDCLLALANGDEPTEMTDRERADWRQRFESAFRGDGGSITLGRMFGEDGCEHTSQDWHSDDGTSEDHAEQCEQLTFSWSRCDVCGSTLGGAREAVTFWEPAN